MPSLRANYRPTAYLVDTLVPAGSVALVAGTPGIGKTWLSLSLGYSVALGRPFLGHFGCLQGRALVVLEEEDPNSVKERVDLLYAGMGISPEQGDSLPVEFLIQQGAQVVDSDGNLDTAFEDAIREYQPDLVVIDPLRRVHNLDENDSGSMSGLFSIFRQMTHIPDNLCSVVVVHHLRKASELDQGLDRLRGSSDIAASVDSVLEVSGEFGNLRVRHAKSKRGPAAGAFLVLNAKCDGVKMEYVDPEKKAEQEREDVRGFIIAMLRENPGGCNQSALKELADARKMSYGKDRLKRVADELVKEGTVTATDGPRNSVVYLLSDQFVDGTRPPSTTSSNQFATPTHPPLANCSETDHAPPEDTL